MLHRRSSLCAQLFFVICDFLFFILHLSLSCGGSEINSKSQIINDKWQVENDKWEMIATRTQTKVYATFPGFKSTVMVVPEVLTLARNGILVGSSATHTSISPLRLI